MAAVQHAIERIGLYKFIQSEFEQNGVAKTYNKPAVKIYVYSSFFLDGSQATVPRESILYSIRQDAGLTKPQFKKSKGIMEAEEVARKTIDQMQNFAIISDFRNITKYLMETFMN